MTKILVIEDEETIRKNIVNVLHFENYDVVGASNGKEGVEKASQYLPDLILCDVMMPELDGYEVLRTLRNVPQLRTTPFIFLTAKADKSDVRQGMVLGADDYLTKPFTSKELLEAVVSRLERQKVITLELESNLERAKKSLSQMVAHELRTPLVSITMVQDLIARTLDRLDTKDIAGFMEMMGSGTRRLQHVVEQMVFLTHLEAGILSKDTLPLEGGSIDLEKLINEAIALGKKYAIRNKTLTVHLTIDAPPELKTFGDVAALKFALAELITNAIHFSKAKGKVHIIETVVERKACIQVIDQGIGMEINRLKEALKPFEQLDREKTEQQGMGVGLTLAKQIIELHSGRLEIASVPDQGTQVSIYLPIVVS